MNSAALRDLLDAIIAKPDDDDARLVYADALTSVGDPRGEFIVVQVALAQLGVVTVNDIAESDTLSDADAVRAGALLRRQNDLLDEHAPSWIGALFGDIDFRSRVRFRRGFVSRVDLQKEEDVRCIMQFFDTAAPGVEALHFVKSAAQADRIIDAVAGRLRLQVGALADLRALVIDERAYPARPRSTLSGAAVERLIRGCPKLESVIAKSCPFPLAPHLEAACASSALTLLNVEGLTPEMVMRVPCMRHVKVLNLREYGERGPDFLDVSVCPKLEDVTLQRFGYHPSAHLVSSVPLTFITSDAFKNRKPLPALKTLRFEDNSRTRGNAVGELLDSKIGSTLKEIEIDGIGINNDAVEVIAASSSITKIDFRGVAINSLAMFAVEHGPTLQKVCIDSVWKRVEAPILEAFLARHPDLRILSLRGRGGGPIYEGKLVDVLAAHAPSSLRALTLHNWDLADDERVSAFVRSPSLANLRSLRLHYCAIGDGGAQIVSEAPMPNLVEISLNLNAIRARGIRAFEKATQKFPGLAALFLGEES